MQYHQPALASECMEALDIKEDGIYVDATFGGGGHAKILLEQLGDKGRLIAFDQDEDALANVPDDKRLTFVQNNFRYLKRFLRLYGISSVDGILADLGVSSHQLDVETRGFSFRFDSPLDMRMNQKAEKTAADLVNSLPPADLQQIFSKYGEVRNARSLAQAIVSARNLSPLDTVGGFLNVVEPLIRGNRSRYLAQVFQALRIELNEEMEALKEFLDQSLEVLKPGGRLAVISYHSIEDRYVKYFFKTGNVEGVLQKDFYGNIFRPFKIITKKAILPTDAEVKANPRARSAKLRVAEKMPEKSKNENN